MVSERIRSLYALVPEKARTFVLAAALVLLAGAYSLSPWGQALNRLVFDSLFLLRGPLPVSDEVILVAIDEPSFQQIGQQWPWPRSLHAHLIEQLFADGARAVAFDVMFSEPSPEAEDQALRTALERHPQVVLATDFNTMTRANFVQEIQVLPAATLLSEATRLGRINHRTDDDGFIRQFELFGPDVRAMAFEVAQLYRPDCCRRAVEQAGEIQYINYRGPPGTVPLVSYYQALERERFLPPGTFKDKMVFIGLVTTSAADPTSRAPDHFPMPYSRFGAGYIPGVEIHANAVMSLLADDLIAQIPEGLTVFLGLALGLGLVFFFLRASPVQGALALAAYALLLGGLVLYLFMARSAYLNAVHLVLPVLAAYVLSPYLHYARQRHQRVFIERAFSSYLAPSVVRQLIEDPESLKPGGQNVEATILFLDIEGFTALSERFAPEELIEIMNRFMGAITEEVLRHDGMIDKFIGDAVMAVWGAPLADPEHAVKACRAALTIAERVRQRAAEELHLTGATVKARIGLNSGTVVAGNIGGEKRFDYTVLGNDVNLASRLEGVNKQYGTGIMIGEATVNALSGQFVLREIDAVRVKGKKQPVAIFELQAEMGALSELHIERNEAYAAGLACYREARWDDALKYLLKAQRALGSDGPSETLIARAREYQQDPPPPDWDGVYDMQTK